MCVRNLPLEGKSSVKSSLSLSLSLSVLSCRLGVCHLCSVRFLLLSFLFLPLSLLYFAFLHSLHVSGLPSFFLCSFFCHSNSSSVAVQDQSCYWLLAFFSFRWIVTLCVCVCIKVYKPVPGSKSNQPKSPNLPLRSWSHLLFPLAIGLRSNRTTTQATSSLETKAGSKIKS